MVRSHSISRVSCTPDDVPSSCADLGPKLQNAVDLTKQHRYVPEEATDIYWSVLFELFDTYGYGGVGDSNSVWGRQHRLIEDTEGSGQEAELRSAARALGLIVQETRNSHSRRDVNIFAPSLDRFVGYDHPMNAPLSDVIIAEHDPYRSDPFIEVGGSHEVLDEVASVVEPSRDERAHGVLTYDPQALAAIERTLCDHGYSYSVHDSCADRLATREWAPELADSEYLAVKKDHGWSTSYRVHAIHEDEFACGTTVDDRSEYRVLRPETVTRLDDAIDSVTWCGHQACKSRFPSQTPNPTVCKDA